MKGHNEKGKYPAYIKALKEGYLNTRCKRAIDQLQECNMCPRMCGVNRVEGELGVCKTGYRAMVSSYSPHFGEEGPLVGHFGSGTIFFTRCSLLCDFCQNYDISHESNGTEVSSSSLASIMLSLQRMGCRNINFVTPSHVIPQILQALLIAANNGLNIPLVYNSSGYDTVESLKLLDGIFDIYMPDFKFWHNKVSGDLCNAKDYPEKARLALKEMHRQVGDLVVKGKIAMRGLIVRHLIMPFEIAGTAEIMEFLAREISMDTYVNLMDQYRPCGFIEPGSKLGRPISRFEFEMAKNYAREAGIWRFSHLD